MLIHLLKELLVVHKKLEILALIRLVWVIDWNLAEISSPTLKGAQARISHLVVQLLMVDGLGRG